VIRQTAARRYAEAVFQIAKERGQMAEWAEALSAMAQFFSHPDVAALMESPRIPVTTKLQLVEEGLGGLDSHVLNLARLLIAKGRTALAPQIAQVYREMLDEEQGIAHVRVKTAVPLTDEEREALAQRLQQLTGRRVVLETEVDEGIIGGLVVQIGDRIIDGSTRSQLLALRRQLEEARV